MKLATLTIKNTFHITRPSFFLYSHAKFTYAISTMEIFMKNILFFLSLILFQLNVSASVHPTHALNVLRGNYSFKDAITGDKVEFSINEKGFIDLLDNTTYFNAQSKIDSISNGIGPGGLSILTVMLAGGSDEQETSLIIRIYPEQDQSTVTRLLDIVYLENDGPNELSWAQIQDKVRLTKKDKNGLWSEVKRAAKK